ncbi:MAG: class I SAM-dependent methyltransferase [Pseudomonadota bacterium]
MIETSATKIDAAAKFWDRIADRYAAKPVADEGVYQEKLRLTRTHLTPNSRLIEIGCGTGSTALAHVPFVKHILATDLSTRMLEIAEGKADLQQIRNITFRQSALKDLIVQDGGVDAVLAMSVLHLLPDRDEAARRIHGLLKPGGVFVSSTACLGDGLRIFGLIGPIGRALGLLPLIRIFTADELVDSLVAAGFQIETRWEPGKHKGVFVIARRPE